jgi:hypothetical protein
LDKNDESSRRSGKVLKKDVWNMEFGWNSYKSHEWQEKRTFSLSFSFGGGVFVRK